MGMSFARKIGEGSERLYELRVPFPDGRIACYRISINPLKEAAFTKACKDNATVDLTAFGTIMESYFLPQPIAVYENAAIN